MPGEKYTRFALLVLVVGAAVSLGNYWNFVGYSQKFGIVFLIAYIIGYFSSLTNIVTLVVRFDITIFLIGLIVAFVVGTLSGVIPAWRAAKLNPVDALRYE